jgi:hypothetical protein
MSDVFIISEIFLRTGTACAAVVLTAWWAVTRRPAALGLITPATWLAAFYALCMSMTGGFALIKGVIPAVVLIPFVVVVVLFLTVRRRVQWLLLPCALLINASLAFPGMRGDADQLIIQLWFVKPYVLLLMGFLYLLVLILLYLLGRRIRGVLKETV